jgi:hypothetical protein
MASPFKSPIPTFSVADSKTGDRATMWPNVGIMTRFGAHHVWDSPNPSNQVQAQPPASNQVQAQPPASKHEQADLPLRKTCKGMDCAVMGGTKKKSRRLRRRKSKSKIQRRGKSVKRRRH